LWIDSTGSRVEESFPEPRRGKCSNSITDIDGGENGNNPEPEPQAKIDLLVDNIERKSASSVRLGDITGRAITAVLALGHSREDFQQWLSAELVDIAGIIVVQFQSECGEDIAQEDVSDLNLEEDIEEVEQFAEDIADVESIVMANVVFEVVQQCFHATFLLGGRNQWLLETAH